MWEYRKNMARLRDLWGYALLVWKNTHEVEIFPRDFHFGNGILWFPMADFLWHSARCVVRWTCHSTNLVFRLLHDGNGCLLFYSTCPTTWRLQQRADGWLVFLFLYIPKIQAYYTWRHAYIEWMNALEWHGMGSYSTLGWLLLGLARSKDSFFFMSIVPWWLSKGVGGFTRSLKIFRTWDWHCTIHTPLTYLLMCVTNEWMICDVLVTWHDDKIFPGSFRSSLISCQHLIRLTSLPTTKPLSYLLLYL